MENPTRQSVDAHCGQEIKADGFTFEIDDEFCDQVNAYVDSVLSEGGIQYYEVRLDTSEIYGVEGQGGTADAVVLKVEEEQLEIHDAKFGFIQINAKRNTQLMTYAAAALLLYDSIAEWKKVRLVIHQPPINHYDVWECTVDDIKEFVAWIKPRAQKAAALYETGTPADIRAAITPNISACEWCPIRGSCEVRRQRITNKFADLTANVEMTDNQIAESLILADEMENFCRALRTEANRRALSGRTIPNHKLIRGRKGNRYWVDASRAEIELRKLLPESKIYIPRELISPTEAEKVLKKNYAELEELKLVGQNEGAVYLVHESERGKPVTMKHLEFDSLL